MKRALVLALLVAAAVARPELVERVVRAQGDPAWRQPFEPIRIAGNVYYVGTRGLSSFLIVTPGGGIIIDSGEAESVPFIRANVERFSTPRFRREIEELVSREYEQFQARWKGLTVVSPEQEQAARA
jgi:hypothetical protein